MSVSYKGAAYMQRLDLHWDPEDGFKRTWHERGLPSAINGRAFGWQAQGYDVNIRSGGPYWSLVAERNKVWSSIPYIERWSISTEIVERDLFTLPGAVSEMQIFSPNRAAYVKGIKDAVDNESDLDSSDYPVGTYPTAHKILFELLRGVETYEHDYTILERERSFDFQTAGGGALALGSTRLVYTTSQLQSNENIPAEVMFELPSTSGPAEEQTMWGWRIRDQSAELTDSTTAKQRTSWVYAQWSNFLYTAA